MAKVDFTQHQQKVRKVTDSVCGNPFYQLHDTVTSEVIINQLNARLGQLKAMLIMTCGDGPEDGFNGWSHTLKNDYLWACAMLAEECDGLANYIQVEHEQPAEENSHD